MIGFLALGSLRAQESTSITFTPSSYYTFNYMMTFPLGDFHEWVSQPGYYGFGMGGRYFVKKGLAFGWDVNWQRVTKEYDNQTYTNPDKGIAINATNYRFTWMVPFQAVVEYHLNPGKKVSPYASLGIGGDYMEHHLLIQELDIIQDKWDFSLTPEIGALVKFGLSGWGAVVAANYKWTTNDITINETKSANLSMFNIKIGIAYVLR
jgi:opacity protein-like surface antigen